MRNETMYHKWTEKELKILEKGVDTYGHKWKVIHIHLLPSLPVQTIKNKYYAIHNRTSEPTNNQKR
jgi:hypothetical protein